MDGNLQIALKRIAKAKETKAEKLDLSGLGLTEIPKEVFELTNLRELYLGSNQLSSVPESIAQLSNLSLLNLSNNQLSSVPESITQLSNLSDLNLSNNQLSSVPESITQLVNLSYLDLRSNQLSSVPASIMQLVNLRELDLRNNQLRVLPNKIGKLKNLTLIHLGENQFEFYPEVINNLNKLEKIYLWGNQLSSVPASIMNLTNLRELHLDSNQFDSVPASIMNLTNLRELHLSNNQLSSVPSSITQLTNLSYLDLRNNQLSSVSSSITQLTNLSDLDLSNNQLSSVPSSITQLTNLSYLNLRNNPIENPPLEVVNKGLRAIKEYFARQKEEGTAKIYEAKILVVGAGGVGKTSLSQKILDANYELLPESKDISTEGIDIIPYGFKGNGNQDFQVNLWDFGGQEIYHSTHQFFLTKRSLYLLVTDSRKEEDGLDYWLNVQQLLAGDSPVFIIQNEKQNRVKELNKSEIRESFSNVKEFLPTNLSDNRGLDTIIQRIQSEVQCLPHIGNELPKSWIAIRRQLETQATNYISLADYLAICKTHGIEESKKALILSGYLHDIGVMLHFQDDQILERLVILNNEWGTDAVYKVIDYPKVIAQKGRFTFTDLKDIWSEPQYAGMHLELVQLMKKFKLCYQIADSQTYITPARLPVEKVSYEWNAQDNTQFRYRYKFMPKGILTRFIVEMHRYIKDQELVWNTGVVLEKENTQAEVVEIYGENVIKVRIRGQHVDRLRPLVMERLDRINESYTHLQVDKLIPCNCETCLTDAAPPTFYREEELLDRKANNKREKECSKSPYKNADVFRMLNEFSVDGNYQNQDLIESARKLIGQGKMKAAFELLEDINFFKSPIRKNNILSLQSKYNKLQRQFEEQLISRDNYNLEESILTKALLNRLGDLESYLAFATDGRTRGYLPDDFDEEAMYEIDTSTVAATPNTVVNVNVNTPTTSETPLSEPSPKPRTFIHKLLDALVVVFALMTLYFSYQWVNANTADWEPLTATSSFVMTLVATYANWRNRR